MNLIAAAQYYEKHKDDFEKVAALFPKGATNSTLSTDIIALINKNFPQFNPNGLIEDTLALIKEEAE